MVQRNSFDHYYSLNVFLIAADGLVPASRTVLISSADMPRSSISCLSAAIVLFLCILYQQIATIGDNAKIRQHRIVRSPTMSRDSKLDKKSGIGTPSALLIRRRIGSSPAAINYCRMVWRFARAAGPMTVHARHSDMVGSSGAASDYLRSVWPAPCGRQPNSRIVARVPCSLCAPVDIGLGSWAG